MFFFFNDTATTEIYTLSLHDALPIFRSPYPVSEPAEITDGYWPVARSEEHTSELLSRQYLVCRLLLEKKNTIDRETQRAVMEYSPLPPLPLAFSVNYLGRHMTFR